MSTNLDFPEPVSSSGCPVCLKLDCTRRAKQRKPNKTPFTTDELTKRHGLTIFPPEAQVSPPPCGKWKCVQSGRSADAEMPTARLSPRLLLGNTGTARCVGSPRASPVLGRCNAPHLPARQPTFPVVMVPSQPSIVNPEILRVLQPGFCCCCIGACAGS